MNNRDVPNGAEFPKGRLTIVGTGIQAITQMTTEAIGYIREADRVFYHATNGVTASQIEFLNPSCIDLYKYYDDGKNRSETYVQMAELMLRDVRLGLDVVGVFHGHPGYFVSPARRALAIADKEGHATRLLPGISAPDCMFADLRIDPGVRGCQILMASYVLDEENILATNGHVVFLQVNAVGRSDFSSSGRRSNKFDAFVDRLDSIYGGSQDCVYYMASLFPGCDPEISVRPIADYRRPEIAAAVGPGMLYLPPKGVSYKELTDFQAFRGDVAYRAQDERVIRELSHHETPPNFPLRRASPPLVQVITDIATKPSALQAYRADPAEFVLQYPNLSQDEQDAIARRRVAAIRSVTTKRQGRP